MMSLKHTLCLIFILGVSFFTNAQQNQATKATETGIFSEPVYVPSIAEQLEQGIFYGTMESGREQRLIGDDAEINPKLKHVNNVVPGKGLPKEGDPLLQTEATTVQYPGRSPELVFDANTSNIAPSDPTGAAGPNHYIAGWNVGFRIFDKSGNPLTPTASLGTIFPGNVLGDGVILYDAEVDRFILTQFDNNPNGFNIAISEGPDPVNDGWYVYQGDFPTGSFPDYTKYSIWHDGYYITANIGSNNKLFVVERDKMIDGDPAQFISFPLPGIVTAGFYSPQVLSATGNDLPETDATVVYMQDDAWGGIADDHLKLWTVDVDWNTPSNSSISAATELPVAPFTGVFDGGSFNNLPQPGGGPLIDAMQATIMNQAQLRKFDTHNSAVFNFVVNVGSATQKQAAIRWYELRQPDEGGAWTIHQEGTYTSPDQKSAFCGSMAMDLQGNIGMGYSTVGTLDEEERIALKYTGRFASDPLGQMTISETPIGLSTANNPNTRYADYAHLTVDPEDDQTFWFNSEYFDTQRKNLVSAFKIAPDYDNDLGVIAIVAPESATLGSNETIEITVRNFGLDPQSNFDVSYQVNNGPVITETFTGTIAPETNEDFTFSIPADLATTGLTYTIYAETGLSNDELPENDSFSKEVTNLESDDLGVSEVTSPISGSGLNQEDVSVEITNYGGEPQSNFEVSYSINSGPTITENVSGTVDVGESLEYTFSQTSDFSGLGTYEITAFTGLSGDVNPNNDAITVTVSNSSCLPEADCEDGDGLTKFVLEEINLNSLPCNGTGYFDETTTTATLDAQVGNYTAVVQTGYENNLFSGWIDYNDNGVFETSEQIFQDELIPAANTDTDISFSIPEDALNGEHLMRVRGKWDGADGDLNDPCENLEWGKTVDFTASVINGSLNTNEATISNAEFFVFNQGNNQFRIVFTAPNTISDKIYLEVYNVLGQKVAYNLLDNENGTYSYALDMSYAASGVYLVRVGNVQFGKVKRIVVE